MYFHKDHEHPKTAYIFFEFFFFFFVVSYNKKELPTYTYLGAILVKLSYNPTIKIITLVNFRFLRLTASNTQKFMYASDSQRGHF